MLPNYFEDMSQFFLGNKTIGKYLITKEYIEEHETRSLIYHSYIRTNDQDKIASLVIIHGLAEHSSRYMEVAQNFADCKINVHLYDQRGSGYSSGTTDLASLKNLYEDFFAVLTKVRKDLPLFLLCHSMGGGSILTLLKNNPNLKISGVIFHNPFIKMSPLPPVNYSIIDSFFLNLLPKDFEVKQKVVQSLNENFCPFQCSWRKSFEKNLF